MFDSPDDARLHLQTDFTPDQTETVVTALVPTLTFRPIVGGTTEVREDDLHERRFERAVAVYQQI